MLRKIYKTNDGSFNSGCNAIIIFYVFYGSTSAEGETKTTESAETVKSTDVAAGVAVSDTAGTAAVESTPSKDPESPDPLRRLPVSRFLCRRRITARNPSQILCLKTTAL